MTNVNKAVENFTKGANNSFDYKSKIVTDQNPIESLSHEMGTRVGAMATEFAHRAEKGMNSGRQYVMANPVKGVAIAAATGLIAGSLITLAMRRSK